MALRWRAYPAPVWMRGEALEALAAPVVAIIGTRRPSARGLAAARHWAAEAVRAGAVVVSGVAPGIDEEAHCAALAAGGRTLFIPAAGLERHRLPDRLNSLLAAGNHAWLSPLPPEAPGSRGAPVIRNYLVAAVADAVIAIETRERGGTFYVVRETLRRAGPLFAVRYAPPIPASASGMEPLLRAGAVALPEAPDAPARRRFRRRLALAREERPTESPQKELFAGE